MQRTEKNKYYLIPAIAAILFLILFILVLLYQVYFVLKPDGRYLLFLVPVTIFAVMAFIYIKSPKTGGSVLAISLCCVFTIIGLVLAGSILVDSIEQEVTDESMYGQVLRFNNYPNHTMMQYFPPEIPEQAMSTQFYYFASMIDNSKVLALKYRSTEEEISESQLAYSKLAQWSGTLDDDRAKAFGLVTGSLDVLGYQKHMPTDLTIYVLYWKDRGRNLAHGERSIVAISRLEREIMFLAEKW